MFASSVCMLLVCCFVRVDFVVVYCYCVFVCLLLGLLVSCVGLGLDLVFVYVDSVVCV